MDRHEPFAALAMCEIAQKQQPQNVHIYAYGIHLAMRCRQRTVRAERLYRLGMDTLTDTSAKDLLQSYYLYRAGGEL